jgi:hypothetical protein
LANTNTEGLQNAYQAEFRILYINNTWGKSSFHKMNRIVDSTLIWT